jgi:hypothetical protein
MLFTAIYVQGCMQLHRCYATKCHRAFLHKGSPNVQGCMQELERSDRGLPPTALAQATLDACRHVHQEALTATQNAAYKVVMASLRSICMHGDSFEPLCQKVTGKLRK